MESQQVVPEGEMPQKQEGYKYQPRPQPWEREVRLVLPPQATGVMVHTAGTSLNGEVQKIKEMGLVIEGETDIDFRVNFGTLDYDSKTKAIRELTQMFNGVALSSLPSSVEKNP